MSFSPRGHGGFFMPRTTGSTAAVAGAEQAAAHADRKNPEPLWTDRAYEHFMAVALRGRPFQTEEVRAAAERAGLPKPPDSRAWGQVALRAIRAGRIRRVGYAPVTQAQSHAGPKSVWQINTTTTTSE